MNVGSLAMQKLFYFISFHLPIIGIHAFAIRALFRKPFSVPIIKEVLLIFSSKKSQGNRSYVELLDKVEVESYSKWQVRIFFLSSTQAVLLASLPQIRWLKEGDFMWSSILDHWTIVQCDCFKVSIMSFLILWFYNMACIWEDDTFRSIYIDCNYIISLIYCSCTNFMIF